MKTNKVIRRRPEPMLRFGPTAWAKLMCMRDYSDNEVGAFGITNPDDLLFVEDIVIVKQTVSIVTVAFDDLAVADFFEMQVDLGRKPEQFARLWLHTHPGDSPNPSMTDEETFDRVFGKCDWSVMFILAQGGSSYARLHFKAGPGGDLKIPVCVDYNCEFAGSDVKAWQAEYKQNVTEQRCIVPQKQQTLAAAETFGYDEPACLSEDVLEQLEKMDPAERQELMDELAVHSEFWDEEDWL